jgi:hypothetical protein
MRRGQRINGFVSVSGRREIRDASNLSERYSGSFTRWSTRLNLEAVMTEQLSAQGTFSYTPPVDRPQGRTSSRLASDFGIRYRFMDRRASLRLSFEDPFGLSHSSSESRDPSYIQIGRSEESSRSVSFNLSYAFGGGGSRRGGDRGR